MTDKQHRNETGGEPDRHEDHQPVEKNPDLLNREFQQEAGLDRDLEAMVPPTTGRVWGPASWWRIGLVVLCLIILTLMIGSQIPALTS